MSVISTAPSFEILRSSFPSPSFVVRVRVWGLGVGVRVWVWGLGVRMWGLGLDVQG